MDPGAGRLSDETGVEGAVAVIELGAAVELTAEEADPESVVGTVAEVETAAESIFVIEEGEDVCAGEEEPDETLEEENNVDERIDIVTGNEKLVVETPS